MLLKKLLSLRFGHIQRLNFYGILVIILFNECLIYYLQRFKWESISCETNECSRILLVADPQILDEGSFADDFKFQRYFTRFMEIFPQVKNIQTIYLHGDNDIGGEGSEMVKPSKVKRFNNYFENRSQWKFKHNLNIYHINRIIHEMPLLNDDEVSQTQENSGFTRVFVSHFSIVLTPGAFSYKAIQRFKPHVIFTGHYHKSNQITSEINRLRFSSTTLFLSHTMTYDLRTIEANQEVLEIQVPSCSYRMGNSFH
ncbi:CLUMA_CG018261, isoform A [Clunio marinus]|uniref:CLUMA_CG018261, isoform A n=1 Tax=Clunio marinus TaxID=568069 RepID=A0A1J1IYM3_9DIPT|nr:CLUMA_CG018261, isoform A [Clunio marinus]